MTTRLPFHLRSTHRSQDRLVRELDEFRTTAERAELAAVLDRHSDAETAQLRELIDVTAA